MLLCTAHSTFAQRSQSLLYKIGHFEQEVERLARKAASPARGHSSPGAVSCSMLKGGCKRRKLCQPRTLHAGRLSRKFIEDAARGPAIGWPLRTAFVGRGRAFLVQSSWGLTL